MQNLTFFRLFLWCCCDCQCKALVTTLSSIIDVHCLSFPSGRPIKEIIREPRIQQGESKDFRREGMELDHVFCLSLSQVRVL